MLECALINNNVTFTSSKAKHHAAYAIVEIKIIDRKRLSHLFCSPLVSKDFQSAEKASFEGKK